jgi:hypothetical protein
MANLVLDQERVNFLKARTKIGEALVTAWPRQNKELPIVEVDVNWVKLSTLNHRTKAEQMKQQVVSGKSDLFTSDPLGPEAQSAQFEILAGQEGFEAIKADLKDRGQQEPAIITIDGVLINGNRRSAALRNLYNDENYLKAQYIRCLVLPEDATPDELLDLEAELQVAQDFKRDYTWINEAFLIEELYDRENKDFDRVANRMHRTVNDVRSLHEKLQQVHQLVGLSNGAKNHIDFDENESAFDELNKHIKNKPAAEADSVRSTYFLGTLAGVTYRKLRHLRRPDAASLVLNRINDEIALEPLMEAVAASHAEAEIDPLDDLLGPVTSVGLNDVLSYVATKRPEEVISAENGQSVSMSDLLDTLQNAIEIVADEAEDETKDQSALTAPITRSGNAIRELERAVASLPRARTFPEWDEAALTKNVDRIKALIGLLEQAS